MILSFLSYKAKNKRTQAIDAAAPSAHDFLLDVHDLPADCYFLYRVTSSIARFFEGSLGTPKFLKHLFQFFLDV